MDELLTQIAQYAPAVVVMLYVVIRLEQRQDKLTDALIDLTERCWNINAQRELLDGSRSMRYDNDLNSNAPDVSAERLDQWQRIARPTLKDTGTSAEGKLSGAQSVNENL